MTRWFARFSSASSLLFLSAAACGSGASAGAPRGGSKASSDQGQPEFTVGSVHYERRCAETYGDECNALCRECWSECAGVLESGGDCTGICDSICDCSGPSSQTCDSWSSTFDFGTANSDNEAACNDLSSALLATCTDRTECLTAWLAAALPGN